MKRNSGTEGRMKANEKKERLEKNICRCLRQYYLFILLPALTQAKLGLAEQIPTNASQRDVFMETGKICNTSWNISEDINNYFSVTGKIDFSSFLQPPHTHPSYPEVIHYCTKQQERVSPPDQRRVLRSPECTIKRLIGANVRHGRLRRRDEKVASAAVTRTQQFGPSWLSGFSSFLLVCQL